MRRALAPDKYILKSAVIRGSSLAASEDAEQEVLKILVRSLTPQKAQSSLEALCPTLSIIKIN
jgi:hypothetical protein